MIPQFDMLVQGLNLVLKSRNFAIHYCLREPAIGPGNGRRGVANHRLVTCYLDNLERLYATITGPQMGWTRKPKDQIEVYLLDLADLPERSPLAILDPAGPAYLVLPCRSTEPCHQIAHQRAGVEAIHEATHAFSFSARDFLLDRRKQPAEHMVALDWLWFSEATSVFMEIFLMTANPEAIRFVRDWSDSPEISLDHPAACYSAGMFARYLARKFDPSFLTGMWHESLPLETPFDILDRLAAKHTPALKSPEPKRLCPIFRDYCVESHFVWDPHSVGFAADVYGRFGTRALTESVRPEPGAPVEVKGQLDHLACRYYRLRLAPGVRRIQIDLASAPDVIVADAIVVAPGPRRSPTQPISPAGVLTGLTPGTMDYAIVVVTNIGLSPNDAQDYSLRFTAS